MQRYEKYKDSGVEWIGEIPEEWGVKPFKRFAAIGNGRDHKNVWDVNGEYPIIGSGSVFGHANKYLWWMWLSPYPPTITYSKKYLDNTKIFSSPNRGFACFRNNK